MHCIILLYMAFADHYLLITIMLYTEVFCLSYKPLKGLNPNDLKHNLSTDMIQKTVTVMKAM